jgi:hypothetical protein
VAARGRSLAHIVRNCRSLEEANDALHTMGLRTELDLEREMASLGTQDYRDLKKTADA